MSPRHDSCHESPDILNKPYLLLHVQGWAKEWSLGCVNSRPAARGSREARFTQPRDHSSAQPCTLIIRYCENGKECQKCLNILTYSSRLNSGRVKFFLSRLAVMRFTHRQARLWARSNHTTASLAIPSASASVRSAILTWTATAPKHIPAIVWNNGTIQTYVLSLRYSAEYLALLAEALFLHIFLELRRNCLFSNFGLGRN